MHEALLSFAHPEPRAILLSACDCEGAQADYHHLIGSGTANCLSLAVRQFIYCIRRYCIRRLDDRFSRQKSLHICYIRDEYRTFNFFNLENGGKHCATRTRPLPGSGLPLRVAGRFRSYVPLLSAVRSDGGKGSQQYTSILHGYSARLTRIFCPAASPLRNIALRKTTYGIITNGQMPRRLRR